MKKILLIIFLFSSFYCTTAQDRFSYGVRAGRGLRSTQVGLLGEIKIIKHVYLAIEANYMNARNLHDIGVYDQNNFIVTVSKMRVSEDLAQFPILAKFKFGQKLKFYSSLGFAPLITLSSKAYSVEKNYDITKYTEYFGPGDYLIGLRLVEAGKGSKSVDISDWTNKYGKNILLSFGFEKQFKKLTPFIECRFSGRSWVRTSSFETNAYFTICGGVKF